MDQPIKLIVGPSPHYRQLKSGEIKYQKSKPAGPVWRILLLDEDRNLMHTRAYAAQPSAEDIERVVMGILSAENLLGVDIVVPTTVEKLCPGLQKNLWLRAQRSICRPTASPPAHALPDNPTNSLCASPCL